MKNKLITDVSIGQYIELYYPEVEIVEYSISKRILE